MGAAAVNTTDADIPCPHCGRLNQAHTGRPGTSPADGSVGICWSCHRPAIFTRVLGQLGMRLPTLAEQAELDADDDVQRAIGAIAAASRPQDAAAVLWGSN